MVVHEARRSGPPIYALHLLRWLAQHADLDLRVLLLDGGDLEADLADVCPTETFSADPAGSRRALAEADVVYVNTAVAGRALAGIPERPRSVLTHIHELEIGLRYWLPRHHHDLLFSLTDRFLVGPACAAENLVQRHGVAPDRIGRVPYFVPPEEPGGTPAMPFRVEAGIAPDAVVIGACGVREWRKGPDLFAHVVWELERRRLDVALEYVWFGSAIASVPHWSQEVDLALLGLEGRIRFIEHGPAPERVWRDFDVFVLSSREDTFPLACLGAAGDGVPPVCFEAGGIPELVRDSGGGGRVVPYGDVRRMADEIEVLAMDAELRAALGARVRRHVEKHHQIEQAAPVVRDEIERLLRERRV